MKTTTKKTKTAKATTKAPETKPADASALETKLTSKGKVTKTAKAKPAKAKKAAKPATGKGATILALVARKGGATLAEIMKAADWQAHSVRGFISTANKKGLAQIASAKNEAGDRVYQSA